MSESQAHQVLGSGHARASPAMNNPSAHGWTNLNPTFAYIELDLAML